MVKYILLQVIYANGLNYSLIATCFFHLLDNLLMQRQKSLLLF